VGFFRWSLMETNPSVDGLFKRYRELQEYVGWTDADAMRLQKVGLLLEPYFSPLIDDFYAEIERHPEARKVITGGQAQIDRLKGTLLAWVRELFTGNYDANYVLRRWKVGRRHVEIGLDQVFTNVALSRLRRGIIHALQDHWIGSSDELQATLRSINTLLDLDLATIEDAYQSEYAARQQRSDRLAAIGHVAGGVAHELRNPLNVVKTSVYFLLNARDPTPEKKAEHLKRIERQVVLADGVITALTNFARMPVPDLRPFAAKMCVEQALEANPVSSAITVALQFPERLCPVLADIDQVRIVFSNLIRNAREAMANGGRLTISATQVDSAVEVAFVDTGTGISAEHLNRIMEPLYSTKARGLGLGLALARAILEKNKGSLHVASEQGKGSAFTVRLTAAVTETDAIK